MYNSFPPVTLGIDYGTKRIGLAISRASLVEPLEVVEWAGRPLEVVLAEIIKVCERESIKQLVVGVSEGNMAEQSRNFGKVLSEKTGLPVAFADETLTSQVVEQKVRSLKKKKRGGVIDHYAAALILEDWLDGFEEL
jgi:putative holliday junction resolvase